MDHQRFISNALSVLLVTQGHVSNCLKGADEIKERNLMNQKAIGEHWFFEKLPEFAEAAREMRQNPASAPVLGLRAGLHWSSQ